MSCVTLTIGFVTDLHFGPAAYHDGKLRKLTHRAAELTLAGVGSGDLQHPLG